MAAPTVCVPGQRISRHDDNSNSGNGTYSRNGFIYSSLAGFLQTQVSPDGKTIFEVRTQFQQTVVPHVDAKVTAKVTNVNPRFCKCAITSVERTQLKESFRGMIRREDVRATEKDKIEMYKCFRPGDIIVARVLSLGDAHSYLLSTAENGLGVVIATGEAGVTMVPISWCEMQCPKTLAKENRKVAQVQKQFIDYNAT